MRTVTTYNVSAAFFIEQEFQQTGSFVYRFYKSSLGRQPSCAEFGPDRAQVVDGGNSKPANNRLRTRGCNDWSSCCGTKRGCVEFIMHCC